MPEWSIHKHLVLLPSLLLIPDTPFSWIFYHTAAVVMGAHEMPVEKEVVAIEHIESVASDASDIVYDDKATQRLIRKIDWRLLPFLALLYLLSFLDRTNVSRRPSSTASRALVDSSVRRSEMQGSRASRPA